MRKKVLEKFSSQKNIWLYMTNSLEVRKVILLKEVGYLSRV